MSESVGELREKQRREFMRGALALASEKARTMQAEGLRLCLAKALQYLVEARRDLQDEAIKNHLDPEMLELLVCSSFLAGGISGGRARELLGLDILTWREKWATEWRDKYKLPADSSEPEATHGEGVGEDARAAFCEEEKDCEACDRLDAVVAALERAEARVRELEEERRWQPIETAPKDGTPIIAWDADDGAVVLWWIGAGGPLSRAPRAMWTHNGQAEIQWDPVAWMPIPPTPRVAESRQGEDRSEDSAGETP